MRSFFAVSFALALWSSLGCHVDAEAPTCFNNQCPEGQVCSPSGACVPRAGDTDLGDTTEPDTGGEDTSIADSGADDSSPDVVPERCGDGRVTGAEACDPNHATHGLFCTDDCTWQPCLGCEVLEDCEAIDPSVRWDCLGNQCIVPDWAGCEMGAPCGADEECVNSYAGPICVSTLCGNCIGTECPEDCENGIDDNFTESFDCGDEACSDVCGDEDCFNGMDDNDDGFVDCSDPMCEAICGARCVACGGGGACGADEVCEAGVCARRCDAGCPAYGENGEVEFTYCDSFSGLCVDPLCGPVVDTCEPCDASGGCMDATRFCMDDGWCRSVCAADGECVEGEWCDFALGVCVNDGCPPVQPVEICGNGLDDDHNGFQDCADNACAGDASCLGCVLSIGCHAAAFMPFEQVIQPPGPSLVECRSTTPGTMDDMLTWSVTDPGGSSAATFSSPSVEFLAEAGQYVVTASGVTCTSGAEARVEVSDIAGRRVELVWTNAGGAEVDLDLHVRSLPLDWLDPVGDCYASNAETGHATLGFDGTNVHTVETILLTETGLGRNLMLGVSAYRATAHTRVDVAIRVYDGGDVVQAYHQLEVEIVDGSSAAHPFWTFGTWESGRPYVDAGPEYYDDVPVGP